MNQSLGRVVEGAGYASNQSLWRVVEGAGYASNQSLLFEVSCTRLAVQLVEVAG